MTYEETIDKFRAVWSNLGIKDNEINEFFTIAIECIEKQIPKRIVDGNFCPRCNVGFGIHYPEWCGSCGQRIDYNMEKE